MKYFLESAIPADVEKQNYSVSPSALYVDIEEQCEVYKRPFLFFAKEQKYWFKDLGFWVDAHCTRCTDCRIQGHEIRDMQKRYQELINKDNRTVKETKTLKQDALELYQLGYMKDKSKIDQIK